MRTVLAVLTSIAFCLAAWAQSPTPSGSPLRLMGETSSVLSGESPSVVFLNTFTGAGYWTYPRGQWVRVDLKPYGVPATATAAILQGTLIITMSSAPDWALVSAYFRRPGAQADCANTPNYTEITGIPAGGQRTPFSDIAPLSNGEVEVCIRTLWGSPANNVPLSPWEASFNSLPSYAVNVRLRGWLE